GDDSVAAMADGASMLIGAAHVATTGSNATAVLARQSDGRHGHGRDRHTAGSKIAVIGSTLSTSGDESAAVKASGKRSAVLVAGSTLTTTGQGSHGAEAESGGKIVLSNSTVNVSGNETAAIYAESERS